jgi:NADPH-dependent glutamate synthase beta subunit-like oxidoreductase/Pyruvate/2-oxoacid:ferredoxin oxidoreductase delta subunit
MAYSFTVDRVACINCGICMDLCPVRCVDMTRPTTDGELASAAERLSPIPALNGQRPWMMLTPVQTAPCIGCQVCAHECPTNAIIITSKVPSVTYAKAGPISHLPPETGWQPLDAYTRAVPEEPGEAPWGNDHGWKVAERGATWQTWRTWLGERTEDLRAPCQAACPVGTNAGLYVSLVAEGRYDEAFRVAAEPNPFPSICGRVCTAPCEAVCRRGEFDAPIAIRDLKRFAGDHTTVHIPPAKPPKRHYTESVAVVGAGPTGLSAAYYLARRGYSVTVFDAMPVAGGMMAIGIPPYRLPRAELQRDVDRITSLGVTLKLNTAIGHDLSLDDLRRQYKAVLLAVGAQQSQKLGVPGEQELAGIIPATTFLKNFNLDSTTQLSGDVAVIGGGSTALDAARSALRAGATTVHILYRRSQAEMPAQVDEVRAALAEGIQIHEFVAPLSFVGTDGKLTTIHCQRMQPGEPDENGRRRPIPISGSEFDLVATTVLTAIGEAPDPSFLPPGSEVGVADWGGLLVNPTTLATGAKGVFAAGDVTYGPASVIEAAAHGRKAAKYIHAFLRNIAPAKIHELPDDEFETPSTLPADGFVTIDLASVQRAEMPLRTSDAAHAREIEFATGLTEAQARREASRCLRCDLAYLCPSIKVAAPAAAGAVAIPAE